jgi:hypothetical protein
MLPVAVAVTVTEQLPDDRLQTADENVTLPVPETFDQVTVPLCDGYPPDRVDIQVISVPVPKNDCVHDKVVVVGAFLMVSVAVRKLP